MHPDTAVLIPYTGVRISLNIYDYCILVVFILVASTNAVNLTDGLDGLAGGLVLVAAIVFVLFAWMTGQYGAAVFAGALGGGCLGFLCFNYYPARVFMGDTGSLALGGALAALAVLTRAELVFLILGGVFVLETLSVIIQVVSFKLTGRRVFRMSPLHHHFELSGWPETRVVHCFWMLGLCCAILAFLAMQGVKELWYVKLTGKRVLVIGLARSGQAVARFLAGQGAMVTATDIKEEPALGEEALRELRALAVTLVTGGYPEVQEGQYDLAVVSPGVPLTIPPLMDVSKAGRPGLERDGAGGPVCQGTDYRRYRHQRENHHHRPDGLHLPTGRSPGVGSGKYRHSPDPGSGARQAAGPQGGLLGPRGQFLSTGTLSGVPPPHRRLFEPHPGSPGPARHNGGVRPCQGAGLCQPGPGGLCGAEPGRPLGGWPHPRSAGPACWFSTQRVPAGGIGVVDGSIVYEEAGVRRVLCPVRDVRIPGRHNLENALAAAATALLAGIDRSCVAAALSTFPGVPHRLEPAGVAGGVKYVNDSKGTNPESVLKALDSFQEPIILIAGGKPKGSDFTELAGRIRTRVKALILLGQAAPQIEQAVRAAGYTAVWNEADLEGCVRTRGPAGGARRPGPAVTGLRQLGHVSRLRGERRSLQETGKRPSRS